MSKSSGMQGGVGPEDSHPIFKTDGFDDIDEASIHGAYIGGLAGVYEDAGIATSYKRAAEMLLGRALADECVHEVVLPVLFLYRHALELRLKFAVRPVEPDHNLGGLARALDGLLATKRGAGLPETVLKRIEEIAAFDPRADGFRFTRKWKKGSTGDRHFAEEVWVNLVYLRTEMSRIDDELCAAAAVLWP